MKLITIGKLLDDQTVAIHLYGCTATQDISPVVFALFVAAFNKGIFSREYEKELHTKLQTEMHQSWTFHDIAYSIKDCDGKKCPKCKLNGQNVYMNDLKKPKIVSYNKFFGLPEQPQETQPAEVKEEAKPAEVKEEAQGVNVATEPEQAMTVAVQEMVEPVPQPSPELQQTQLPATSEPATQWLIEGDSVRYVPLGSRDPILLRLEIIKQLAAPYVDRNRQVKTIPDDVARTILIQCAGLRLDPAAGDVSIVPFYDRNKGDISWTILTRYYVFYKRAQMDPTFSGVKSGLIIDPPIECKPCGGTGLFNGNVCPLCDGMGVRDQIVGAVVAPHLGQRRVIGAWATVQFTNGKLISVRINRDAYWKQTPIWEQMGNEMLVKCAEAAALRRAFPAQLGNLYIPEEMPATQPAIDVETAQPQTPVSLPPFLKK